ncbi:MAG: excinuclease ABC subunit UvrC [Porticoccaceae bacterium]|nr:excinuclease ABC subunit UvrC [Porticoccaceae bacterium]
MADTAAFDSARFLKTLTQRPGVYQMMAENGDVLYVGKAKNLRKRVSSYFRTTGLAPKTRALVSRIHGVQVTVTGTEIEALILEQNLIKQYHPPYNVLLRDDKSYPYIHLSAGEPYPRLSFHRGTKKKKGQYFGPYPSVNAVRESLVFLQKTFRVRQCDDSFYRNRSRPCLQYQIKRCTGPCVGLVSEEDYQRDVRHTELFLDGKNDQIIRELEKDMDAASTALAFEKAAELRDKIIALRQMQSEQIIESGQGDVDVIAAAVAGDQACIHMLYIRHGRMVGSRSFYLKIPLVEDEAAILNDFISQFYLGAGGARQLPKEILTQVEAVEAEVLSGAISQALGRKVDVKNRLRATRARWCELAQRTAEQNLAGRMASRQSIVNRFESLRDTLGLDQMPERIECFDISHSSGEATVASCVVFGIEGAIKSDYRRFNIDGVVAGDDYAAMEQAIKRRFTRLKNGEGKIPDILLIDGGKGQLRKATEILTELGIVGMLVVGVAKGVTRKPGMETLFLAGDSELEILRPQAAALHLIQQVRDEAHRFAITGHRQRRDKKRRESALETIDGIGPKRRRELLRYFGGYGEVEKAGISELMKVPGISRKVAETIYSALHNE